LRGIFSGVGRIFLQTLIFGAFAFFGPAFFALRSILLSLKF
jgi:hypothetical protein